MRTSIARWGNSLALRLPRQIADGASLAEGVPVEIEIRDGALVVTPVRRTFRLDDLLAQMKPEHRHPETGWGDRRGEEVW